MAYGTTRMARSAVVDVFDAKSDAEMALGVCVRKDSFR